MAQYGDIERIADEVTGNAAVVGWPEAQRVAAVETLMLALSDDWLRQDPDAEDAVCSALEAVGVMRRTGNLVFELVPDAELVECDREVLRRCRMWLPRKYEGRRC